MAPRVRPGARLRVFDDAAAVAAAAAEVVREEAAAAIAARGRFRLALPGGRTPEALVRRLAEPPLAAAIEWERVDVLFADERAVPHGDPARNDRLVRTVLAAALGARAPRVHAMPAESPDLEAAARAYETMLAQPIDLMVLGIGEDGHIASLFPGSPLLGERDRRVAAVTAAPKPPPGRLTLTPRAIGESRRVLVLATGAGKAAALERAFAMSGTVDETPARLVSGCEWLVDAAAAGA